MSIKTDAYKGLPVNVRVIDSHTHIGVLNKLAGMVQQSAKTEDVIRLMERLGIDCILTAPYPCLVGNAEMTNALAAQAAAEFPGKIYGLTFVSPYDEISETARQIDKCFKNPSFVGMKLLPLSNMKLSDTGYQYALAAAHEAKCPVMVHDFHNHPTIDEIRDTLEKFPGIKLILAHQGGGSAEMTDITAQLATQYENLYIDTCGSVGNIYTAEQLVEKMGEDRVIFGTDMIYLEPRYELGKITFSDLSDRVKKKVLAENYLKLTQDSQLGRIK